MTFDSHSNFAYAVVVNPPGQAGVTMSVTSGAGALFPTPPFNAIVWPTGALPTAVNAEIVRVTAVSTDTFTITRAQEGSTAKTVTAGYQVACGPTAKTFTDIETVANAAIPLTQRAAANGVATLDGSGQVPSGQLGNVSGVTITSPAQTLNIGGSGSAPTVDVGSAVLTSHDLSALLCGPLGVLAPTGSYALLTSGSQKVGDGSATTLASVYSTLAAAQVVYSFATSLTQTVDYCAVQLAINTISGLGGGRVYIPRGNYALSTSLVPANLVSVYGDGQTSVLLPYGTASAFLLIGSSSSYLTDVTFRDFKIDGTNQSGGYSVATKGIQCQYARRVTCDNVQVFNTIATGIAFDFPDQVAIVNCVTFNTGRLWTSGAAGGAGIGIGVGVQASPDQTMIVANCHCYASGSYGIFFEAQDTFTSSYSTGVRVIGNYCTGAKIAGIGASGSIDVIVEGNTCSNNGTAGSGTNTANIALDGGTLKRLTTEGTIVQGNVCAGGKAHGILVIGISGHGPRWCQISNNIVYNNGGTTAQDGHGIFLNGSQNALVGISVNDNTVTQNKQGGIVLASGTGHQNIAIRDNDVFSNGQTSGTTTDGVQINAPVAGLEIVNNQVYKQGAVGNQVTGINLLTGNAITQGKISGNDVRGNGTTGMTIAATLDATTIIRDNPGYNPVGTVSVSVPASGSPTTAAQIDQTFYITTGTGTTTAAISGGPTITLTASALNAIRVPAGQTLTPTYTNAPTWLVEGE
jgi:hypothetical protein